MCTCTPSHAHAHLPGFVGALWNRCFFCTPLADSVCDMVGRMACVVSVTKLLLLYPMLLEFEFRHDVFVLVRSCLLVSCCNPATHFMLTPFGQLSSSRNFVVLLLLVYVCLFVCLFDFRGFRYSQTSPSIFLTTERCAQLCLSVCLCLSLSLSTPPPLSRVCATCL